MNEEKYQSVTEAIRRAQAGDMEACERLVTENDALVRYVVKKYIHTRKEYDDLYQQGRIGLVRAVQNFREDFGTCFSTYAVPMIMGEIRRFLRDDGQMRISRTIKENAKRALECMKHYRDETGREARLSDVCEMTGLASEDAALALGALRPVRSLNEPVDESGSVELKDTLSENPFEDVEKSLLVQNLLSTLNEKERKLIELRFFKRLTQARVADILGLTQVQVSRLEKRLLLRMRKDAV